MLGFIKKGFKRICRKLGLWSIEEKVYVRHYQVAKGETLKGKNILITGGTSGIGLAIAKKCLEEGASVVVTGRNKDKLSKVLTGDKTGHLKGMIWDVSELHQVDTRLKDACALFSGEIDVLVNNAGISIRERFGALTENVWNNVLSINLTAPVFLAQAIVNRWLGANRGGIILNISSMAGLEPSLDAYSVAKCGLNSMTKGMARIWAAKGIRVNALAVGVTIGTELRDIQRMHKPDGNLKCPWIPVGRFAVPAEIAETAAYIISDGADYLTGAVVELDGAGSIAFGA